MVFSPFAYQYEQNLDWGSVEGLVRGDDEVFGAVSDPETELQDVEAAIQQRQEELKLHLIKLGKHVVIVTVKER